MKKIINGIEYDDSQFLLTDGDQWELPLFDVGSDFSLAKVATYTALLSPRGVRGQSLSYSDEVKSKLKSRLRDIYQTVLNKADNEIPRFIMNPEMKSMPVWYETSSEIDTIEETEYKGVRGLILQGPMSLYTKDQYQDHVLPTEMLLASSERYFNERPAVMFEHGLDKTIGYRVIGESFEHKFLDDRIDVRDFIPEPSDNAGKKMYERILKGEYKGFSVGGVFYRDTGVHAAPGYIVDWDLDEHSVCRMPVHKDAKFFVAAEFKSEHVAQIRQALDEYKPTGKPGENQTRLTINEDSEMKGVVEAALPSLISSNITTEIKSMNEEEVKALTARLEALEAEKKEAEMKSREVEMKAKAEAEATRILTEQAQSAAEEKKKFEAAVSAALEAKSKQFSTGLAMGLRMTSPQQNNGYNVPNLNGMTSINGGWVQHNPNAQNFGPSGRMTMAGEVKSTQSKFDENGRELPAFIIDWLYQAKYEGRRSSFNSDGGVAPVMGLQETVEGKTMTPGLTVAPLTTTPAGSAGGFVLPTAYLMDIVPYLVDVASIRNYATVLPAEALVLEVPRDTSPAVRAAIVAPGTTKPKVDYGTDLVEIRQYTIPLIVDITNQLLRHSRGTAEQFLLRKLRDAIRLAEYYYALQGTGTGMPLGVIPAMVAANTAFPTEGFVITRGTGPAPSGLAVSALENIPDAIARALNVQDNRHYVPTAVMCNNNNFWDLQQIKDTQGRYILNPNIVGPVAHSVWGIPFIKNTLVPNNQMVIGKWDELYIYLGHDLLMDSSSEAGDRWDRNLTGFRVEEEMGMNANQNFRAFTLLNV